MRVVLGLGPALVLLAAMTVGLVGGFTMPTTVDANVILWPSIFAQTVVAVGALRHDWVTDRSRRQDAVRLLIAHHVAATVPYLIAWLLLPAELRGSDIAIGLLWLAIVPTAAGLPAYATAARVSPNTLTAFALLAYVCGLLVTPLLALAVFGGAADVGRLMLSMLLGLIAPALIGMALGRFIRRIPAVVRTGVVAVSMTATTYVFGSSIAADLSSGGIPIALATVALLAGAARVPLGAGIARLVSHRWPRTRAASVLAGGYKNDALAATAAIQVAGPLSILPALGSLLAEMVLMLAAALSYRAPVAAPNAPPTPPASPAPRYS